MRDSSLLRWGRGQPRAGQPVPALGLRRVDGPGVPGLPVRKVRRRRPDPLQERGSRPPGAGRVGAADEGRRPGAAPGLGPDRLPQGLDPPPALGRAGVLRPSWAIPSGPRHDREERQVHRVRPGSQPEDGQADERGRHRPLPPLRAAPAARQDQPPRPAMDQGEVPAAQGPQGHEARMAPDHRPDAGAPAHWRRQTAAWY